ncbi:MAG TPA: response regulator transcription factor [Solirubrobacteraceae bacterium]|nr:response regulator transcription factor [Solirubrobacteraceae bacterium]
MAVEIPSPWASLGSQPTPAAARPVRVLLADDREQRQRHLRGLLERQANVELVAQATDLDTVEGHLSEHLPRVLVLELGTYDGSGVSDIRRLRKAAPNTRIVVLTTDDSPTFARHALDAGASAFVVEETADSDLPQAIERAARGGEYVSPGVSARLQELGSALAEDALSTRETEVLRLIALGYTSVEIAERLRLSPRTVETHRARIYRKLGLATRSQVVRYALGRGLLSA